MYVANEAHKHKKKYGIITIAEQLPWIAQSKSMRTWQKTIETNNSIYEQQKNIIIFAYTT